MAQNKNMSGGRSSGVCSFSPMERKEAGFPCPMTFMVLYRPSKVLSVARLQLQGLRAALAGHSLAGVLVDTNAVSPSDRLFWDYRQSRWPELVLADGSDEMEERLAQPGWDHLICHGSDTLVSRDAWEKIVAILRRNPGEDLFSSSGGDDFWILARGACMSLPSRSWESLHRACIDHEGPMIPLPRLPRARELASALPEVGEPVIAGSLPQVETAFVDAMGADFRHALEKVEFVNLGHLGYGCRLRGWFTHLHFPVTLEPAESALEFRHGISREDVAAELGLSHARSAGWEGTWPFHQGEKEMVVHLNILDSKRRALGQWRLRIALPRADWRSLLGWSARNLKRENIREALRLLGRGEWRKLLHAVRLAVGSIAGQAETAPLSLLQVAALAQALSAPSAEEGGHPPVDIIVPVYNGAGYLRRLLESLRKHTAPPYRLILIDDASTEPEVEGLLTTAESSFEDCLVLRNETNMGFVLTVNRGLAVSKNHVVILNTDTEVPAGWLERLMKPLADDPRIASVTPMTNSGEIASHPRFCKDNPLPEDGGLELVDGVFRRLAAAEPVEAPTGVGFCMLLNRAALDAIGSFDAERFGLGYGEENDWCQRAMARGYRNVIQPGLFVWHKHGGSFESETKQRLLARNLDKLRSRHPDYERQVRDFIRRDPLRVYRWWAELKRLGEAGRKPLLIVDHAHGGGANTYSRELIDQSRRERPVLRLVHRAGPELEGYFRHGDESARLASVSDWLTLVDTLESPEIFYNSLYGYPTAAAVELLKGLDARLQQGGIRLTVGVHDYMPVCPAYTLLNDTGRFCRVPRALEQCRRCLPANSRNAFPGISIERWRGLWRPLLERADRILAFSEDSVSWLARAYAISEDKIEIEPHRIELPFASRSLAVDREASLHIAVVGAINKAKGAEVVARLVRALDRRREGRLTVVGKLAEVSIHSDRLTVTGGYRLENLPEILENLGVNVGLIPSIWPETFNLVASELMALELPLACFDIGAPRERIGSYAKGSVLPLSLAEEPEALLEALERLRNES